MKSLVDPAYSGRRKAGRPRLVAQKDFRNNSPSLNQGNLTPTLWEGRTQSGVLKEQRERERTQKGIPVVC